MESLFNEVKTFCLTQGSHKNFWIAYSGGLDSHVLLHICARLQKECGLTFKAIHVNHHLSPYAASWVKHCDAVCQSLDIDFISQSIHITLLQGDSLEAVARELRYKVFADYVNPGDILLTAQHQDDQAETVLIQLMRGAGPKGLSAMPKIKPFGIGGTHGRPLLNVSRKAIEIYAREYELQWIEDESNKNIDFSRNFLRHDILPLLKKRWPSIADTLSRVAEHCAETQYLLDESIKQYVNAAKCGKGLSIAKLLTFSSAIQRQVLRLWFSELHFPIPSVVKMQQIQQSFLQAGQDKSPYISWGHVELRRYQNVLHVMKKIFLHDEKKEYQWDMNQPLLLPNIGVLCSESKKGQGLKKNSIKQLKVRFRRGGEFCQLPGREFHHDLKKLFQQWSVPPWERTRVPLLFLEDKLIAVVGYFINEAFAAREDEEGFMVRLLPETFVKK